MKAAVYDSNMDNRTDAPGLSIVMETAREEIFTMKSMKSMKSKRVIALLMALLLTFSALPAAVSAESTGSDVLTHARGESAGYQSFTGTITTAGVEAGTAIKKYGNVQFRYEETPIPEGYEAGDMIRVSFLGQELIVPYCSLFSDVDSGQPGLFHTDDYLVLAINLGDFATTYGVATKDQETLKWTLNSGENDYITFTFSMYEKRGYYDEYVLHHLSYSDERNDYKHLSDEEFSNFRQVSTAGIGSGKLFRTSSPIDPAHKRNKYADDALRDAGVTVIMNLADDKTSVKGYEGFDSSYYSGTNYITLEMSMDPTSENTKKKLAEGFRFFAKNPGVYAIHCKEGKDRTGFVCAIVECLMGASLKEVTDDYMLTFYNFYGITPDDERYEVIKNSNIVKSLARVFRVDDLEKADLAKEAREYLLEGGMTLTEIARLKVNLSASKVPVVIKKINTLKTRAKLPVTISRKSLRSADVTIERAKAFSVTDPKGKVSYKKVSGNKKISVDPDTGNITAGKKLLRGIYRVKVKVKAAGNSKYKSKSRIVTVKILVI